MDLWRMALDLATEARDDIDKPGTDMTADQKLPTAQIYATLAVAQVWTTECAALSRGRHGRVRPRAAGGMRTTVTQPPGDRW